MDWLDLTWTVMCTTALSLSVVHVLVWTKQKDKLAHLFFALAGASIAVAAFIEIASLRAQSASEYAALVRWFHVPLFVALVSLVLFVRLRFTAGHLGLVILFCALRLVSLVANFSTGVNLQFVDVTGLQPVLLWGADIVVPLGAANPWMLTGQASLVVLALFMADAALQVRREQRSDEYRRAARTLLSIVAFVLIGGAYASWAVTQGSLPLLVTPAFMAVVLVMAYELSLDVARNYELTETLHLSELGLELAGQKTLMGQWAYCQPTGTLNCSQQARTLLGFDRDQAIDTDALRAIVHEADLAGVAAAFTAARESGGDFRAEFRVADGSGGFRWLISVGRHDIGNERDAKLVQGVLLDITERRQLEERFRQVVQASPIAKLVVEQDGRIVFANEAAERIFGYAADQFSRMNVDELVPASSRRNHAARRDAYAESRATRRMGEQRDLRGLHRDGHEIPLEIGLAPIPSDHGMQILATITDISGRKAMERESALQREELAHLSRVALLSELSGSLAHELNQPLTAILSNAQAALRYMAHSPPNLEEVRESLVNIVESDKRAGEVIRRLRVMLRKDPPEFQLLDPNEVVQDVLRIIRSDLLNRSIETRLELAADLPLVLGDRVQLQQVILNLIMNGADAMSANEGGRVLTIRSRLQPEDRVEVQISDVGKGIPESDLERIFSPFVTSKNDGLGLGLAVCTTIVQTHGGRLWASNNAGPGATLHLELPLHVARGRETSTPA